MKKNREEFRQKLLPLKEQTNEFAGQLEPFCRSRVTLRDLEHNQKLLRQKLQTLQQLDTQTTALEQEIEQLSLPKGTTDQLAEQRELIDRLKTVSSQFQQSLIKLQAEEERKKTAAREQEAKAAEQKRAQAQEAEEKKQLELQRQQREKEEAENDALFQKYRDEREERERTIQLAWQLQQAEEDAQDEEDAKRVALVKQRLAAQREQKKTAADQKKSTTPAAAATTTSSTAKSGTARAAARAEDSMASGSSSSGSSSSGSSGSGSGNRSRPASASAASRSSEDFPELKAREAEEVEALQIQTDPFADVNISRLPISQQEQCRLNALLMMLKQSATLLLSRQPPGRPVTSRISTTKRNQIFNAVQRMVMGNITDFSNLNRLGVKANATTLMSGLVSMAEANAPPDTVQTWLQHSFATMSSEELCLTYEYFDMLLSKFLSADAHKRRGEDSSDLQVLRRDGDEEDELYQGMAAAKGGPKKKNQKKKVLLHFG
eukprot:TRINITY_DN5049_c0_g4_i1.p1 TRINITY_DN5049_c0_g4~~TRINITY_DN5049_c0_g4_i1.p1  ORF type:complete len:490 (-),score=159.26 TRINITY_DN5049_c0_g4_i1:328-1797(-)